MTNLSPQQQAEIDKLNDWFQLELVALKKRQLAIMEAYDTKKTALLQQHNENRAQD